MSIQDEKQKEYLRSLGYSENVIDALFSTNGTGIFADDGGQNLIKGFEIALTENMTPSYNG